MANYFNLVLDTTAPSNPTISVNGGATYSNTQLVDLSLGTSDGTTTGYEMKIWGDVDISNDASVQDIESSSAWITYATSKQVKLSSGDGTKSISVKIRDDVWNVSALATDSITLDTTKPTVTTTTPDVSKISEISGRNVCSFSFSVSTTFIEYKVKVVSSSGSAHDTGVQIGTGNGSMNMSGTNETTPYPASTPIDCQINGTDLKTASSGDGNKIIKVFARDEANNWSV